MRFNANTVLAGGAKCVLVPYREEHVNTYHCWMQDPALQEATASEPLTLDEEHAMQRAWRDDGDKLTFIVLDRRRQPDTPGTGCHGGAMAGDVNLFFLADEDEDDEEEEEDEGGDMDEDEGAGRRRAASSPALPGDEDEEEKQEEGRRREEQRQERQRRQRRPRLRTAEIEVMIAEPESRRGGLATEALRMLMAYAVRHLAVRRFVAKIGAKNAPSLALFSGGGGGGGGSGGSGGPGLGFLEFRRVAAFDEVHLALDVRPGTAARAELEAVSLVEAAYDDDDGDDDDGEQPAAAAGAAPEEEEDEALLPAVPAELLRSMQRREEDDSGGLAPDALARRLAAVAGATSNAGAGGGGGDGGGGDGGGSAW